MKSHLLNINNIKVHLLKLNNVHAELLWERSSLQNQVDRISHEVTHESLRKHARIDHYVIPASLVPRMEICRKIPVCCTEVILKVRPTP